LSREDVPFQHPFGFDWNLDIKVDPQYESLVAPDNQNSLTTDVKNALDALGLPYTGMMHVETDQGLIPDIYRAQPGDRVVVFGRWIVDCGHDPFGSEIHPPLVLAYARSNSPDEAHSMLISRPYLVGQEFGDGALRQHLLNEVARIIGKSLLPPPFNIAALANEHIRAHPHVYNTPFSGLHLIHYIVRPASPRPSPADKLSVSFHFTVRTGVTVQLLDDTANDAVGVLITMNNVNYTPAPLPQKSDWNITMDELKQLQPEAASVYQDVIFGSLLANPFAAPVLARGLLTDRYEVPAASSARDSEVTTVAVNQLGGGPHFSVDDGQPFPIYGFLDVRWAR
jgi:hypothetical protein